GRGAADDGYAAFAALTSIQALQVQGVPHARCVVLIEACEESGSYDLPHYVDALAARIGTPSLVVCLDSGCSDYEHLWTTTSLRGVVNGVLTVEVLTDGGNVLRPLTAAKLSLRLPPTVGAAHAAKRLKETLEAEPPYGARVTFEAESPGDGWDAPATAPWLTDAMRRASEDYFGQPAMSQGTGGSIPFMAMLGARYPQAQFMITGVLGPDSNAHGPNEYLHVPTGVRVTACVASV